MRTILALLLFTVPACLLPMSHAAMQQHAQRMCSDTNYAYETGYNKGLEHGRLDTTWVDQYCAPEAAPDARNSYQAGFQAGIANAPVTIDVRGTTAVAASCTFSSDCGDGQTCRDH